MASKPPSSDRYAAEEFQPYIEILGKLALAWNELQESLASLFWMVSNPQPQAGAMVNYNPLFAWASIRSDRTQREMLRAVICRTRHYWGPPGSIDDLKWIVDTANALEEDRNNAIHSPLFSIESVLSDPSHTETVVAPATWLFHPRAIKLSERSNLLAEFHYCYHSSLILGDYAREVDFALLNCSTGRYPWPKRPLLPNRPPKKSPPNPPPQSKHK